MPKIQSDVTGTIWKVEAAVGQHVGEGDTLLIVESMKMEIPIVAPAAGVVSALLVAEGEAVSDGQVVASIE